MANILVVDDERNVRNLIKKVLEENDHSVTTIATGEEALVELRRSKFDLLILDLRLPGMSGTELLKLMKQEGIVVPTLIVSAVTNAAPVVEALKQGAGDYLSKPFSAQDLVKKVEELLNREQLSFERLARLVEEKLEQGRLATAEKLARELFSIRPDAEAHFIYAMVMEKVGNKALAHKYLKAALALDPDHRKALKEIAKYEES
ncbi:MAG: Response regulator receiver protein [Thermotoga sp. 50_1627]|uniref:response regulator n=1 Tax=Pseudothermotoga sp. TaxID=2033661 RepID=UPI00076BF05F|nr:MAG: Response regulator receiver protein [Thermotoga sp. 50_64]KUK25187.1 MAG: Response regulator receiver protein [Thermotoga sp. 50_1627]MBC7116856.1 response regulator [Pseudothermotoga sp.]MDK2923911.1 two-component system, OmpR family, response regulator [Pseudothermotoga sp.]HBT39387.1 response regulator [Pseudothermotoga sp.]